MGQFNLWKLGTNYLTPNDLDLTSQQLNTGKITSLIVLWVLLIQQDNNSSSPFIGSCYEDENLVLVRVNMEDLEYKSSPDVG